MSLQLREDLYTAKKGKMTLNNEEINRYSRHLTLPEVGMGGQLKLKEAKVLMIGAGGLGSPLGMYLGAVGVGKLGLVDFDVVDHTNLHRQIAHASADEGDQKSTHLGIRFWLGIQILKLKYITFAWSEKMFSNCSISMTSLQMDQTILKLATWSTMPHTLQKTAGFGFHFPFSGTDYNFYS